MIKVMVVVFVLLQADDSIGDECGIWKDYRSFREIKYLLFQDFMDGYIIYFLF